jgi:hypothetical protein
MLGRQRQPECANVSYEMQDAPVRAPPGSIFSQRATSLRPGNLDALEDNQLLRECKERFRTS